VGKYLAFEGKVEWCISSKEINSEGDALKQEWEKIIVHTISYQRPRPTLASPIVAVLVLARSRRSGAAYVSLLLLLHFLRKSDGLVRLKPSVGGTLVVEASLPVREGWFGSALTPGNRPRLDHRFQRADARWKGLVPGSAPARRG